MDGWSLVSRRKFTQTTDTYGQIHPHEALHHDDP